MADREFRLKFLGDARNLLKAVNKSSGGLKRLGGALKQVGKFAAIGAAATVAALVTLGPKIFDAAAKLELMRKKTKIVFGDSLPVVQKWARGMSAAMGVSVTEAAGLAAGLGDLLIPMGFTREAAVAMATETVGLSAALAEWSAGQFNATEVTDVLAKAMLGEREGLKALGISIMEADITTRLLTKGQEKLTGAALQQAKAIATQELIFEKSTDAQAAFAAGGEGMFRTQQRIKAALSEVREALLTGLMPVLARGAAFLSSTVVPALERLSVWLGVQIPRAIDRMGRWFADNREQIVTFFTSVREVAVQMFGHFRSGLGVVLPLLGQLAQFLANNKPVMIAAIVAIGLAIAVALGPVSQAMLAITGIILVIGIFKDKWRTIANAVISAIEWMANKTIDGMIALAKGMLGPIQTIIDGLNHIPGVSIPSVMDAMDSLRDKAQVTLPRIAEVVEKSAAAVAVSMGTIAEGIDDALAPMAAAAVSADVLAGALDGLAASSKSVASATAALGGGPSGGDGKSILQQIGLGKVGGALESGGVAFNLAGSSGGRQVAIGGGAASAEIAEQIARAAAQRAGFTDAATAILLAQLRQQIAAQRAITINIDTPLGTPEALASAVVGALETAEQSGQITPVVIS